MLLRIILFAALTQMAYGLEIPKKETDFLKRNAAHLKPGGPGTKEAAILKEVARIAAQFENYEAISAMFQLTKTGGLDASAATEFEIYIYKVFIKKPLFFISSADKYYRHNFDIIMFFLISEGSNNDYAIIDKTLKALEKEYPNDSRIKKFRERAEFNNSNLGKIDLRPKN